MSKPDITRILEFQKFLLTFRGVKRTLYIPGTDEAENDVDHSYFLALLAWFIAPQIDTELDTNKIIKYALIHDLVETYAGDTFAFDVAAQADKKEREHQSLIKIKENFSDFPGMIEAIEAYEQRQDRESKFVYALDKMTPAFLSSLDGGRCWIENEITFEAAGAYDAPKVAISGDVMPYYEALQEYLSSHPEFYHPS
ncbi:MAG: HD domain-containing protein [Candidatus Saccharimonadales bacterium]